MFEWIPRFVVIVTVAMTATFSLASRNDANAVPFVVGTLDGPAGSIVAGLVANAQASLDISVLQSSALDATFFNQIDVFLFANGQGALTITLGATKRANLLDFVTNGGHVYMGLDLIGDGNDVAALFGFNMIDRQSLSQTGSITDLAHPITTGPFQPATDFRLSTFGRFDSSPANSIIGTAAQGDVLGFLDQGDLAAASGKVYIYSDEVPLFANADHNNALFKNALVDMGAMLPVRVPEPGTLALFGVGLLGLGCMKRRRRAA